MPPAVYALSMPLNDLWRALCAPEISFSALLTLRVCIACLILHALTAIPLARLGMAQNALIRRVVNFVITLPLVFPPMALGFLLLMFLGRHGWGGIALRETMGVSLVFRRGASSLPHGWRACPLWSNLCKLPSTIQNCCATSRRPGFAAHRRANAFSW